MGELDPAGAGHHKGPGAQLVPRLFLQGVGLAGEHGLVDLDRARTDHAVGGDLPSRMTVLRGAASSLSLSMVRLERSSWKMPMAVLAMAMKIKVASR